ncbi:Ig-like domain-containing protein [Mycolicibacterium sp. Dal123E01]|uniref:Ig-like domain-containing protein n=1 Tax=Mycolicibacterium sp. Dal123E01 TaxID=3457578 RepID=UPI00403EAB6C
MTAILIGKTLRFEKSIGRIGALAVALGVGVGLGTSLACGVAHADGPSSPSSSSGQSGRATSPGNAAGSTATAPSGESPTHARGRKAGASEVHTRDSSGGSVDGGGHRGRDVSTAKSNGSAPKLQPADEDAGRPAAGGTHLERSQPDEAAPGTQALTEGAANAGSGSSAPVATAASTVQSSNQVSGSALASLLGAGAPGDDPVGSPGELVLLAGARREFGGRTRLRPVATSSRVTSEPGPDESAPLTDSRAGKTLSALATPRAAASPLESFIGNIGTLINTALTAINNAVGTALTAINTAVTTTIAAISSTITNLLTAIGVIPNSNKSPTVVNDGGVTTVEDTPVSLSTDTLLGNDSDPDGDTLTVSGVATPAHGSAVLNGTTVTYTPNLNYAGVDSFAYTVSDGHGGTATGTVAVTVTPVNDAPVALGNTVSTAEDTPLSVTAGTLLGNDSDADGDTLTVAGVSVPAHGSVVLNGAGVTYTPNLNYAGVDSFTYTVSDGHSGTATGTVSVTVTPVNDAPVAGSDSVTTAEGTPVSVSAGTLLGNDSDVDGDTLTVTGITQPTHGSAVLNGAGVTYTPAADFNGVDSLTYTVSDGHGGTATGTVSVTVTPVNDAPVAGSDSVTTAEGTPVSAPAGTLLGNDSDVDGDTLTVTGISQPAHGSAVLNGAGVTYTPAADFNGVDSLTYTVSDGHGGTATGTVSVTVTPVNDAPVAGSDSVTTAEGTPVSVSAGTLLGNDSDVDGDTLTVTGISQPAHGSAVLNGAGVTYTPAADFNGVDSLTYTVSDGHGGTATGTVSVTVTPVNDAPVAGSNSVTTTEDTAVSVSAGTLLGNDSDPDGDALTVTGISQPLHGSAVLDGSGVVYTPDADFNGVDSLTYTISDGHGGTATGTVSVTVTPVNDAPTAVNDTVSTAPNTPVTINVLGNDIDVDGDPLNVALAGVPAHGTVVANEDGTLTYTPAGNYTGTDSFTYTISDGATGNSATVTVTVAVPVAHPLTLGDFHSPEIQVTANGDVYVIGKAFVEVGDTGMGYDENIVGRLGEDGSITPVIDLNAIVPGSYLADVSVGPDGRVYVLDNGWYGAKGTLTVYDSDGTPHVILDDGELGSVDIGTDLGGDAVHMAVGNDGKIYLAAWAGFGDNAIPSALTVLNADGTVAVAPVDLGFRYSGATDLVVGADGRAYVLGADPGSYTYTVVVVGPSGSVDDRISLANLSGSKMAVGADGTIYVTSNSGGVVAVNATGPFGVLNELPSDGTSIGDIAMGPQGLYVVRNNGLSVVDPGNIKVQTVLDSVDDFKFIVGLTVGPDGAKYVAGVVDTFLGLTRLARVNVNGTVSDLGPIALNSFGSIAAGPNGLIYAAGLNGITVIDTATGSTAVIPVGSGGASHLAVGGDGTIYFTGYNYDFESGSSGDYLSAIDAGGNVVLAPVYLGDHTTHQITGLALGPDGRIYTTSYDSGAQTGEMTIRNSDGTVDSSVSLGVGGSTGLTVGGDGTAYVVNGGRVIAVDSSGPIGTVRFNGGLASVPTTISMGTDGLLYVAVNDYSQGTVTSSISVLDPTDLIENGATNNLSEFVGLYGISVGNDGQKYVIGFKYDSHGFPSTSLVRVSADGASVTHLVDFSLGNSAIDVENGPDGRLYVTDNTNGTVTAYDPANGYAAQLIGTIPGAAGLAFGNGRIYISSIVSTTDPEDPESMPTYTGALTILSNDGSLVTTVNLDAGAPGVSVGPDGRVYVATFTPAADGNGLAGDGELLIFSAGGVLQKTITLADRVPYNVTVGPDGTAYIADLTGHVLAVGQDGTVSNLANVAFPFGLDFGPDGTLYVTSIGVFNGSGATITAINPASNL